MRVCLLNSAECSAPKDSLQRNVPALRVGVASIAAVLRAGGHEVSILDPLAHNLPMGEVVGAICAFQPDLLGLPTYTEEVLDAAEIAEGVKQKRPHTLVVAGGYHVSALPERSLEEFKGFDIAVIGEGEAAMEAIAGGVSPAEIPGIAWRDTDGTIRRNAPNGLFYSLDDLPLPAWELYDLSKYTYGLSVEASRTCPSKCLFCYQATSDKTRHKSPEKFVDEVCLLRDKFGANQFSFASAGSFPLHRDNSLAIMEGLEQRAPGIKWFTTARADRLDREVIAAMKRSGCCYVSLGIETGDQEILSRCQKGLNLERAAESIRLLNEGGLETELCFILGLPGETRDSLELTRRYANRMRRHATMASFAILTPYPGTEVFRMAECGRNGLELATTDWSLYTKHSGLGLKHQGVTARELRRWQFRLYMEFYFGSPVRTVKTLRSRNIRDVLSVERIAGLFRKLL